MFPIVDQLRMLSAARFEQLLTQLLLPAHPELKSVDGRPGDKGVDLFEGTLDPDTRRAAGGSLHVWQAKYFLQGIGKDQKKQIRESYDRVMKAFAPEAWTLCVPVDLDIGLQEWVQGLRSPGGPAISLLQASDLEALIARNDAVRREYFIAEEPASAEAVARVAGMLDDFTLVSRLVEGARCALEDSNHSAGDFYDGAIPDWRDIVLGLDARRDILGELWALAGRHASTTGGRIPLVMLTGSSGEGKTTVLMRLAHELARVQPHVYFHDGRDLDAAQFRNVPPQTRLFLFIDNITVSPVDTIIAFLTRLRRDCVNAVVFAAATQSLWKGGDTNLQNVAAMTELELGRLSDDEIEAILARLSADPTYLGNLADLGHEEQLRHFRQADRQLLVALLEAKHNGSFREYVLKELNRLETAFGEKVFKACLYVSALHRFNVRVPVSLLQRLFPDTDLWPDIFDRTQRLIHVSEDGQHCRIRHALIAETIVAAQPHPAWLYEKITAVTAGSSDEKPVGRALRALAKVDAPTALRCLSQAWQATGSAVLLHVAATVAAERDGAGGARELFREARDAGRADAVVLASWGKLEALQGNLGNLEDPAPDTARALFRAAVDLASNSMTWLGYILAERNYGTVGTAETPYTLLWLFEEGLRRYADDVPILRTWAIFEQERRNLDAARSLYARLVAADPENPTGWCAWAILESSHRNYEGVLEPGGKELFRKAADLDPREAVTWASWGKAAAEHGEIGNVDTPYTARWMLKQASELKPAMSHPWAIWSTLERRLGNYGDRTNPEPYTARALSRRNVEVSPDNARSWLGWAELERDDGVFGDARDPEEYTARWLFLRALEVAGPKETVLVLSAWAKLEQAARRFGLMPDPESATARGLYLSSYRFDPGNNVNLYEWGRLEAKLGNHGDAENPAEFTARWLYARSVEANPENTNAWAWWARLEAEHGNVDAAERYFIKALGLGGSPKTRAKWCSILGSALVRAGRKAEAAVYLQRARRGGR